MNIVMNYTIDLGSEFEGCKLEVTSVIIERKRYILLKYILHDQIISERLLALPSLNYALENDGII